MRRRFIFNNHREKEEKIIGLIGKEEKSIERSVE